MTDDNSATVSWWTPDGWIQESTPPQFAAYETSKEGGPEAFGYRKLQQFGDADQTTVEIIISFQADHWLVEIWSIETRLCVLFVRPVHYAVFVVDKLSALLRDFGIIDYPSELSRIRKAVIAFIRYGHGERTIDEDGYSSRDDDIRLQQRMARARAAKAATP